MPWVQKSLSLPPFARGCHLITACITDAVPELTRMRHGLLHIFLRHTSASLTLSENADPDVRADLEMAASRLAPEDWPYAHAEEGPDDMPAHVKNVLFGSALSLPVCEGALALGRWQGICLWEHRDRASAREVVLTLHGECDPVPGRSS